MRERRPIPVLLFLISVLAALVPARSALAYRPFDGTDAAVADPGELELELGPAGIVREGSQKTLIAPAAVLNLGIVRNWEAVLQGEGQTPISPQRGRTGLLGNELLLKGVVREGVLQGAAGPSIATEYGALLPGWHGEPGTGASLAGIVSERWNWLTAHFNAQAALTREHRADYFLGTIFEGPFDWAVRPVGEIFYERNEGTSERTWSGLVGAIWQARDNLAFDLGLRDARVNDRPVTEFRLGLTIGFSLW